MAGFLIPPGETPEQMQIRRKIAQDLMKQGTDASPVGHWTQALARGLQGTFGGYQFSQADKLDKEEAAGARDLIARAFGGAGDAGATAGTAAAGSSAAASPATAVAASATTGASPEYDQVVDRLIQTESGGDPNARARTSSATGSGQFIDSTWLATVRRHRPDLMQGRGRDEILAMRTDPALSREMTMAHTRDNAAELQANGLPVTPGTIKLAHFLGSGGARTVLTADPNASLTELVPQAVAANSFLRGMTAADARAWADRQMTPRDARASGETMPSAEPKQLSERRLNAMRSRAAMLMQNPRTEKFGQTLMLKVLEQDLKGDSASTVERGTTPHAMTDADGNLVYGTIGKDGTWRPLRGTEGYRATPRTTTSDTGTEIITRDVYGNEMGRTRKDVAGKEREEEKGKAQGQAVADLPRMENNANTIYGYIEALRSDPYLPRMTGPLDARLPNLSGDAARVQSKADQVGGQAFLQAFSALKGAGQITETEGAKATAALSRLQTMGVNDADYSVALDDFKREVDHLLQVARTKAGGAQASPDIPRAVKTLRYNAQTGELE